MTLSVTEKPPALTAQQAAALNAAAEARYERQQQQLRACGLYGIDPPSAECRRLSAENSSSPPATTYQSPSSFSVTHVVPR